MEAPEAPWEDDTRQQLRAFIDTLTPETLQLAGEAVTQALADWRAHVAQVGEEARRRTRAYLEARSTGEARA